MRKVASEKAVGNAKIVAKGSWKASEEKGGVLLGDGLPAELSRELAVPRTAGMREMMARLHRAVQWSSPWHMQGSVGEGLASRGDEPSKSRVKSLLCARGVHSA